MGIGGTRSPVQCGQDLLELTSFLLDRCLGSDTHLDCMEVYKERMASQGELASDLRRNV